MNTPDKISILESNIDDMSPQLCQPVADAIIAAGALDVYWTPIIMKKGRPALLLTVMCRTEDNERVAEAIFRNSTSLGIRYRESNRFILERNWVAVETKYGSVRIKLGIWKGQIVNAHPEFEDVRKSAEKSGVPVKLVFAAAEAAYAEHSAIAD
ncbi:MAG: nickel insertion protein [Chthonomonadales bacterium]